MRSKTQYPINLKILLIFFFFVFLLFVILRSSIFSPNNSISPLLLKVSSTKNNSYSSQEDHVDDEPNINTISAADHPILITPTCNKISPSLSQALVHYASSNITPQQTLDEISVTLRVLAKKSPCNFLVFGLGHDSLMWTSLNHNGRTVFLEEDQSWINQIKSKLPNLESYHVVYNTKLTDSDELLSNGLRDEECKFVGDPRNSKCGLALRGLPSEIYDVEWDLIMVDAPTGYHEGAPGRMSAIYTAGLMGRNREEGETDVFVHDVNRVVEDKFSLAFLCDGYLREQVGRLRHFTIPSHRARLGRPFCPFP